MKKFWRDIKEDPVGGTLFLFVVVISSLSMGASIAAIIRGCP